MTTVLSLPVRVVFNCAPLVNGETVPIRAVLLCRRWTWVLTLSNFEVVHALSRIVRLLPDKLATARAIRFGHTPLASDDGSFLIKLVRDLAEKYLTIHRTASAAFPSVAVLDGELEFSACFGCAANPERDSAPLSDADDELALEAVMVRYVELLSKVQEALETENKIDFDNHALDLIDMSDDILIACQVFLDFVHPVWIKIRRDQAVDDEMVEEVRVRCERRLVELDGKLCADFYRYRREEEEEEEDHV